MVRAKICGLMRREDALAADAAGADYLGVVLTAGFGRSVRPADARALFEGTQAPKVAVLVNETVEAAVAAARALGADVIQLHGNEQPVVVEALRARGTWMVWKAVRARTLEDVEHAVARYAHLVDGFLIEGRNDAALGTGGARVRLDPAKARALLPAHVTFVLAGGLTADTVTDAALAFQPDVVDVSSGVERALGEKDHAKVRAFIEGARLAGAVSAGSTGGASK